MVSQKPAYGQFSVVQQIFSNIMFRDELFRQVFSFARGSKLQFGVFQNRSHLQRLTEMSDIEAVSDDSSESIHTRLQKKLKVQSLAVPLTTDADITSLALEKYESAKQTYNFVNQEDVKNVKSNTAGEYERYLIPVHDFNQEMYKFNRSGYCANPNVEVKGFVVNANKQQLTARVQDETENALTQTALQIKLNETIKRKKELTKKFKQMREKDKGILSYQGPWAGYGQNLQNGALTADQKGKLQQAQLRKQEKVEEARKDEQNFEPYSNFHWEGKQYDYKGFSYLEPPADFKPKYAQCYIPKKDTQTWVSSQKAGYQCCRFFPKVGHFLMVGNPEGKVHLFDVAKNRTCAHTYVGHTKAIRDIQFASDGKHFLSCAFDGNVHYWDTEYGKVLRTFKLKRIPFTMAFHPSEGQQNTFMVGSNNKKILQFDLNTGTKSFEYSQHSGTINTITFIEQNKFVSSADDKKLFIWEFGIPVVTKHVSEPQMHTVTATALHPGGEYLACQSSDNQIIIYENKGGNFRRIRSKKFESHYCAGYACSIDFSNDGQFLISGDERGKTIFYDWKTSKIFRAMDTHASVCIGAQWHPSDSNMVATCGWEGRVKLWQ